MVSQLRTYPKTQVRDYSVEWSNGLIRGLLLGGVRYKLKRSDFFKSTYHSQPFKRLLWLNMPLYRLKATCFLFAFFWNEEPETAFRLVRAQTLDTLGLQTREVYLWRGPLDIIARDAPWVT